MARISKLANPDFAKAVAEAYVNGMSREEMADEFACHKDTITIWTRDPRVQAHVSRLAQERVNRITRKIDKEIEGRLQDAEEMDTEVLLKIRKEFLGNVIKPIEGAGADRAETVSETIKAVEESPDLADALQQLLLGGGHNATREPNADE
jgi:hypothetical protein